MQKKAKVALDEGYIFGAAETALSGSTSRLPEA